MFGYVRPLRSELKVRDDEDYKAAYCGLCHTLRRRCGWVARYVLNYDFTFLALLLDNGTGERCTGRCPAHPFKKRQCYRAEASMALAADESVILAHYKLCDSIRDDGFWRAVPARLGRLLLRRGYLRAVKRQPEFDETVSSCLNELAELEQVRAASLDRPADTFARLLAAAAGKTEEPNRDRPLYELLYHLGRWIYLLDAYDDLHEDVRKGRYNPIAERFGGVPDIAYLQTTLRNSLSLAQSAFQLLETTRWRELLENILYLGLPAVQAQVFAGTWTKKRQTRSMSQ